MDKEGVLNEVRTVISINTHIVMDGRRIADVVRDSILQNIEISDYTIGAMKSGLCIPGVDKLFILGILLNVAPTEFIRPRDGKGFNKFLSLSADEKRVAAKLFETKGD